MIKNRSLFFILMFQLFLGGAIAQTEVTGDDESLESQLDAVPVPVQEQKKKKKKKKKHNIFRVLKQRRFSLGLVYDSWQYEEPGVMKSTADLYGLNFKILTIKPSRWSIYAEVEHVRGSGRYDGGLQDGHGNTTPYSYSGDAVHNTYYMVTFGKMNRINIKSAWMFFFGLFYQMHVDENDSNTPYDYRREQSYLTIPWGVNYYYSRNSREVFELHLLYHLFLAGNNTSYLSEADPSYPNLEFEQDSGSGLRLELSYTFAQRYQFVLFTRSWDIERSNVNSGFVEPANETSSTGLKFFYHFH